MSLENWYCINFDKLILGGNWDTIFVEAIQINMKQCQNSTSTKKCATQDEISSTFKNPRTGGGLFFSYLYMQDLPLMNNLNEPLKTSLVNKYEIVDLSLLKRNIQTYKKVDVESDDGWFFSNNKIYSTYTSESIQSDFSLKDKWNDNILYSYYMYLGNTHELYNRSYTKVQEVLASIGGFSKLFYIIITFLHFYISDFPKNIFLISMMENEDGNSKDESIYNNPNEMNVINVSPLSKTIIKECIKPSDSISQYEKCRLKSLNIFSYFCVICLKKNRKKQS